MLGVRDHEIICSPILPHSQGVWEHTHVADVVPWIWGRTRSALSGAPQVAAQRLVSDLGYVSPT